MCNHKNATWEESRTNAGHHNECIFGLLVAIFLVVSFPTFLLFLEKKTGWDFMITKLTLLFGCFYRSGMTYRRCAVNHVHRHVSLWPSSSGLVISIQHWIPSFMPISIVNFVMHFNVRSRYDINLKHLLMNWVNVDNQIECICSVFTEIKSSKSNEKISICVCLSNSFYIFISFRFISITVLCIYG